MIIINYYPHKVPGGKLIKVKLDIEDESIKAITVLGDFFLHPEHVLEEIEDSLLGVKLIEATIVEIIQTVLDKNKATLIGANATDLAEAILAASMMLNRNS